MADQLARLPSARRTSFQPVMVVGLTGSELIMVIAAGFGAMAITVLISWPLLGAFHFCLLAGAGLGFAAALTLRGQIVRSKRQTPEGYALQRMFKLKQQLEGSNRLLDEDAVWDCRRHDQ